MTDESAAVGPSLTQSQSALQNHDKEGKEEVYQKFAPQDDNDFKQIFLEWIKDFHNDYLASEGKGSGLQARLFHVQADDFEDRINPDVTGNMIKSIFDSMDILKKRAEEERKKGPKEETKTRQQRRKKSPERVHPPSNELDIEKIDFSEENCKILMEILRYTGRDVNVLELYDAFKTIY